MKKSKPMSKPRQQVIDEIAKRGLVSVMNDTKWRELRHAIQHELPFPPPFQLKAVLRSQPEPESFETEVNYWGDWSDESLSPFYAIEWLRIRPRYLKPRGRLIAPSVQDIESKFLAILHRYHIPYRCDGDSIWIYGYTSETGNLVKGSEQLGPANSRAARACG